MRMTLEVLQAIKLAVPEGYPVGVRLSATDWMDGNEQWDIESTVGLSKALEQLGAPIFMSLVAVYMSIKILLLEQVTKFLSRNRLKTCSYSCDCCRSYY